MIWRLACLLELLAGYALPTLIGNTIGGVTLVALLAHAQIIGDKEQRNESPVVVGPGD